MKIQPFACHPSRQDRSGAALLVVLILICLMLAFAMANTVTVNSLARRVKILDQRQIHRLAGPVARPPLSK